MEFLVFGKKIKNDKNDLFILNEGNSVLWFLILFIIGAYIGKYKINYSGIKKFMFCCLCLFIYLYSTFIFYKLKNNELYNGNKYILNQLVTMLNKLFSETHESIIRIIQTISITLFFLQINYNKYLSKIISFIGPLSFGVYLSHYNKYAIDYIMINVFNNSPYNLTLIPVFKLFLSKASKIFFICILLDYIRHLLFNILRIRKLCILLEKMAFKIFSFNQSKKFTKIN